MKYADDYYLADAAVRGLVSTPGSEEAVLSLMQNAPRPSALLAYAASKRPSEGAEEILLSWLTDYQTDNATKEAVYNALAACGGKSSLRTLADAAAASDYDFGKTDATSAYIRLVNRLADEGDTQRALAALQIILRTDVKMRTQNLLAALRDGDREYRGAALDFAGDFADEALYAAVVRKMPSLTEQARTDIVNWLGARHAASQTDAVVAMIGSDDDELAGLTIVRRSLEEPLRLIAGNAGHEGSVVVEKVREGKDGFGFNAATGEYEDLIKAGVIDPKKVARIALQNAASVASLLLTTECAIAEKPEPKKDMPAMPDMGGMGGMGGMY